MKTPLYLSLRRSASLRRPISLFWYTYIAHKYDVTFLYDAHGAFIILFSRSRVWLSPSRTKNSKVASIFPRRRRRMPLWQKSRGDNETNKVCILRTFLKHKLFNFVFCARLYIQASNVWPHRWSRSQWTRVPDYALFSSSRPIWIMRFFIIFSSKD